MRSPANSTEGFFISKREVGPGQPAYLIAEMSANHNQDFLRAKEIVHAAAENGADAVKVQTYTPDTITIDHDGEGFVIGEGSLWEKRKLYHLYSEASMPWEWQPRLKEEADKLGIALFSSPFDSSAVDFLEDVDMPAYKVASFEVVDIPLLQRIAATGKPVIMSTGMATLGEIEEAVRTLRADNVKGLALLHCVSAYPALPKSMNLRRIPHLAETFGLPTGLSDHTLGIAAAVASVALGACIIEKHLTLSRKDGGPDASFSLEPSEFRIMADAVREAEMALGDACCLSMADDAENRKLRRSLYAVRDIKEGELFSEENVRSIRPGLGMHTRYYPQVLGRKAARRLAKGTPISFEDILRV